MSFPAISFGSFMRRLTSVSSTLRPVLPVLALMFSVALLSAGTANAQVESADILGKVADTTKAVIPAAAVIVTNLDTAIVRKTKSNTAGEFVFTALPIGRYSVRKIEGVV